MPPIVDEVSVLRDAHWLGEQNADLCPEPHEPDYAIAQKLFEAGYLKISPTGKILEQACYRLTEKGWPVAAECAAVVAADRALLRDRVIAALKAAHP
jgi:hypothetical protein